MNYFKVFKNNWKKITFATCAVGYGAHYAKAQYDLSQHLRLICQEVVNLADSKDSKPKRVLVILNPVANKKKAANLFEKYCEPVLHLAGYSVDVLKTNHVGHAKSYIENLDFIPDAIVVAGGDGTSCEVVTGLMRRQQTESPVVLLPLGLKSSTVLRYTKSEQPKNKLEHVKLMTNILLSLVKDKYHYENVIKFDVIDEQSQSDGDENKLKPIYGLNEFSWGLLRDIDALKDKYWYFGNLRHYAAALFKSYSKDLTWKLDTDYVYSPPCSGCLNCELVNSPAQKPTVSTKSYFSKLISPKLPAPRSKPLKVNEHCSELVQGHVEANQLNITCDRNEDDVNELHTEFIKSLRPGWDFLKKLPEIPQKEIEPEMELHSRTIKLIPKATNENGGGDAFYSIDGEEYDVRPIQISLIPNAIKIVS